MDAPNGIYEYKCQVKDQEIRARQVFIARRITIVVHLYSTSSHNQRYQSMVPIHMQSTKAIPDTVQSGIHSIWMPGACLSCHSSWTFILWTFILH